MKTDQLINNKNCPNCGAPIHGCVCEYCDTAFQASIDAFNGHKCLVIDIDDLDTLITMPISVSQIRENVDFIDFYTYDGSINTIPQFKEIDILGYLCDSKSMYDLLRDLRDVLNRKIR